MDLGVRDQGYLVFGGTAGIGRAAAQVLAADGARVAVAGRDRARADAAAADLSTATGTPVVALAGDLTVAGAAEALVAEAAELLGGLRGMAVTTGLGRHGQRDLLGGTDGDWVATFDDVLLATVRACRATVPVLVEAGGGAIVTTAAYSIRAPKPHQVPYGALKAGVATLTKNLAKRSGPTACGPTACARGRPRPRCWPPCACTWPRRGGGRSRRRSNGSWPTSGACGSPSAAPGAPARSATSSPSCCPSGPAT